VQLRNPPPPIHFLINLDILSGGLSIAVPGEVHGHYQAWKQYGRLKWRDLVQPAIDLAKNGFEISAAVAQALNDEMVEKIKEDDGLRFVVCSCLHVNDNNDCLFNRLSLT